MFKKKKKCIVIFQLSAFRRTFYFYLFITYSLNIGWMDVRFWTKIIWITIFKDLVDNGQGYRNSVVIGNSDGGGHHDNIHHTNIIIYDCMITRITTWLGESIVLKNGYPPLPANSPRDLNPSYLSFPWRIRNFFFRIIPIS